MKLRRSSCKYQIEVIYACGLAIKRCPKSHSSFIRLISLYSATRSGFPRGPEGWVSQISADLQYFTRVQHVSRVKDSIYVDMHAYVPHRLGRFSYIFRAGPQQAGSDFLSAGGPAAGRGRIFFCRAGWAGGRDGYLSQAAARAGPGPENG